MVKTKSVYSNERTTIQPPFKANGLKVDTRQQMDGFNLLSKLTSNSLPVVFFDPQYRSVLDKQSYGNEGERQKERAILPQMDIATIKAFLSQIERVLMPSGHLMLWVDKFIVCSGMQELINGTNLQLVDMITWNKQRMGMGYRTRRVSEYLVILQKLPTRAKGIWSIHNIPDVWEEKVITSNGNHTHSKPVGLQERLIEAVTNKGDTVADPCAGSYSVLKACLNTGRHFVGCDIEG
jgi:site-specific DNA-methyltransferase (adenine-specific)